MNNSLVDKICLSCNAEGPAGIGLMFLHNADCIYLAEIRRTTRLLQTYDFEMDSQDFADQYGRCFLCDAVVQSGVQSDNTLWWRCTECPGDSANWEDPDPLPHEEELCLTKLNTSNRASNIAPTGNHFTPAWTVDSMIHVLWSLIMSGALRQPTFPASSIAPLPYPSLLLKSRNAISGVVTVITSDIATKGQPVTPLRECPSEKLPSELPKRGLRNFWRRPLSCHDFDDDLPVSDLDQTTYGVMEKELSPVMDDSFMTVDLLTEPEVLAYYLDEHEGRLSLWFKARPIPVIIYTPGGDSMSYPIEFRSKIVLSDHEPCCHASYINNDGELICWSNCPKTVRFIDFSKLYTTMKPFTVEPCTCDEDPVTLHEPECPYDQQVAALSHAAHDAGHSIERYLRDAWLKELCTYPYQEAFLDSMTPADIDRVRTNALTGSAANSARAWAGNGDIDIMAVPADPNAVIGSRDITEGKVKKGGQNGPPTTPRPPAPKGQVSDKSMYELLLRSSEAAWPTPHPQPPLPKNTKDGRVPPRRPVAPKGQSPTTQDGAKAAREKAKVQRQRFVDLGIFGTGFNRDGRVEIPDAGVEELLCRLEALPDPDDGLDEGWPEKPGYRIYADTKCPAVLYPPCVDCGFENWHLETCAVTERYNSSAPNEDPDEEFIKHSPTCPDGESCLLHPVYQKGCGAMLDAKCMTCQCDEDNLSWGEYSRDCPLHLGGPLPKDKLLLIRRDDHIRRDTGPVDLYIGGIKELHGMWAGGVFQINLHVVRQVIGYDKAQGLEFRPQNNPRPHSIHCPDYPWDVALPMWRMSWQGSLNCTCIENANKREYVEERVEAGEIEPAPLGSWKCTQCGVTQPATPAHACPACGYCCCQSAEYKAIAQMLWFDDVPGVNLDELPKPTIKRKQKVEFHPVYIPFAEGPCPDCDKTIYHSYRCMSTVAARARLLFLMNNDVVEQIEKAEALEIKLAELQCIDCDNHAGEDHTDKCVCNEPDTDIYYCQREAGGRQEIARQKKNKLTVTFPRGPFKLGPHTPQCAGGDVGCPLCAHTPPVNIHPLCVCGHAKDMHDGNSRCMDRTEDVRISGIGTTCPCTQFYSPNPEDDDGMAEVIADVLEDDSVVYHKVRCSGNSTCDVCKAIGSLIEYLDKTPEERAVTLLPLLPTPGDEYCDDCGMITCPEHLVPAIDECKCYYPTGAGNTDPLLLPTTPGSTMTPKSKMTPSRFLSAAWQCVHWLALAVPTSISVWAQRWRGISGRPEGAIEPPMPWPKPKVPVIIKGAAGEVTVDLSDVPVWYNDPNLGLDRTFKID